LIVHPSITGSLHALDAAGVRRCVLRGETRLPGLEVARGRRRPCEGCWRRRCLRCRTVGMRLGPLARD
jgi:hypothetical protein